MLWLALSLFQRRYRLFCRCFFLDRDRLHEVDRHDRVVVNALAGLVNQLRGKPCRPMTDDVAVRIPSGNIRRPE